MPSSKRPRKQHKGRALTIPRMLDVRMIADEHPGLALEMHLAVINLIEAPRIESCNNLSRQLCVIAGGMSHANRGEPIKGKNDPASIAIQSAILVIEGVIDRHGRIDAVQVTEIEGKTLKAAAGKLDEALGRIPLTCYRRAEIEVAYWIKEKEAA